MVVGLENHSQSTQALSCPDGAVTGACGAWKPGKGEWLNMGALGTHLMVLMAWNTFFMARSVVWLFKKVTL